MDDRRKQALSSALSQIERQFGKGAIMRMGDPSVVRDVAVVSTGSLGLDLALGVGGLPRGRVMEIYGPEASGKTTLTSRSSPRPSATAAPPRSSTPSTRSIRCTPRRSGSTSTSCSSPSPTPASRRSRSRT